MTVQDPYDALMARFRTWLFDLPEGETLRPMMAERFTPEEDIPNAPRDLGTRMITERGRAFGQVF